MAWIKATDIAYGRLRAPDLDVMEEFLTRFGMLRADRTNTALYMRGTDPAHHIHVTGKGAPKFVGLAYYAASASKSSTAPSQPSPGSTVQSSSIIRPAARLRRRHDHAKQ